jgi:tRNA nucleotidyltransferase (CCA-adding enzyme)
VRTLRPDSFVEDPTRLLRAVRYAARFGFRLDRETENAARAVAPDLDPSSARVGDELRRLLMERTAAGALDLAVELGVPWIIPGEDRSTLFAAVDTALARREAPRLESWAVRLGLALAVSTLDRLAVDGWARGVAIEAGWAPRLVERLRGTQRPSALDAALRTAKPATAVVALARGSERIADWWVTMRDMRLAISGEDLVAAGVRPGPAIGRALAAVRAARLDGEVDDDRMAQLRLALRAIREAA